MSFILDALRRADRERESERGGVPSLYTQAAPPPTANAPAGDDAAPRPWLWLAAGLGGGLVLAAVWALWSATPAMTVTAAAPTAAPDASTTAAKAADAGPAPSAGASRTPPAATTAPTTQAAPALPAAQPPPATRAAEPARMADGRDAAAPDNSKPTARTPAPAITAEPRRSAAAPAAESTRAAPARTPEAGPRADAKPAASSPPARERDAAARTETPRAPVAAAARADEAPTATAPSAERAALPPIRQLGELSAEARRDLPTLTIGGAMYSANAASRRLIVNGQLLREGEAVAPGVTLEEIRLKSAVLRTKDLRYELGF